ncbi:alanine dehydrogenase [Clostridium sp. WILCCON 0269]|uniref:Alanine dehydrogenase n=1 Tax=Candidatus Clostridium eludens TaxID=3381663 RepID=A0ABW8SHV4_9CLOT
MVIGVPKELKNNENRVAITPAGVHALVKSGHKVIIEKSAGVGSGIEDKDYKDVGGKIVDENIEVFKNSDVIVKVKEPIEEEYELFKENQILFTYLHLAANAPLTELLIKKKITAIAYETVQLNNGSLPLLTPMSEVAGKMSIQIGANLLQEYNGGAGVLLGGVPGVLPGEVVIIGAGGVGTNAAKMALGLGAKVTILDINKDRLAYIDDIFNGRLSTLVCNEFNVAEMVKKADLLVGAVLVTGSKAPKIVTEEMVRSMKKGAVIVDVAIDQGGSIETIDKATTHDNPCYEKFGVIHYSVSNMPGAVSRTSTYALTSSTLPYLEDIANKGMERAMLDDKSLLKGLNVYKGFVTYKGVAESLKLEYREPEGLL